MKCIICKEFGMASKHVDNVCPPCFQNELNSNTPRKMAWSTKPREWIFRNEKEKEMEKTDREMADTYVSMIYHIRNKLQDIMNQFDDERDILAHYQLGGLREYLDSLIGDFEDGPQDDEIPY